MTEPNSVVLAFSMYILSCVEKLHILASAQLREHERAGKMEIHFTRIIQSFHAFIKISGGSCSTMLSPELRYSLL